MKTISLSLFLAFYASLNAQSNMPVLDQLHIALNRLPKKPTIVFTYAAWCGGTITSAQNLSTYINRHRSEYNIILLADSLEIKKSRFLTLFVPDELLTFTSFFPTKFKNIKESILFAKEFNDKYLMQEKYIGNGTSYMLDCNRQFVDFIDFYLEKTYQKQMEQNLKTIAARGVCLN